MSLRNNMGSIPGGRLGERAAMPRANAAQALPDLPASVFTHLGPMPIVRVDVVDELNNRGECDLSHRQIKVLTALAPIVAWQTLGHETAHAIIGDAGLDTVLTNKQTELLCDAFGTWIAAAVASGAVVLR